MLAADDRQVNVEELYWEILPDGSWKHQSNTFGSGDRSFPGLNPDCRRVLSSKSFSP